MNVPVSILIVDDEKIALKNLEHIMKKEGHQVVGTQSGLNALKLLQERPFDIVLTDLKMEKVDGLQILRRCRDLQPDAAVILITGFATLESAVSAMKQGAFNYLAKPFKLDEVRRIVGEAVELVRRRREAEGLAAAAESQDQGSHLLTQDPQMRTVIEIARRSAPTDCSILIRGAVGTGKKRLARFIHDHSKRSSGPFLSVSCAIDDDEALTSALFGSQSGGASASAEGSLHGAAKGTMYLEDVHRMSLLLQSRLMRFLEQGDGAGDSKAGRSCARIIAGSGADAKAMVEGGAFRQDLLSRLSVVVLDLPPLSRRREDLPLLAYYFLRKHSAMLSRDVGEISPETLAILMNYDFPGNVGELESIIERGVIMSGGGTIDPVHLRSFAADASHRGIEGRIPSLEEQELAYIKWVLGETGGNRSAAAQILGIDRVSLWRKLKKYDLDQG